MIKTQNVILYLVLWLVFCGCSVPESAVVVQAVQSPQGMLAGRLVRLPTVEQVEPWTLPSIIRDKSARGLKISTRHYEIFTTMEDPLIAERAPFFMESCFDRYNEMMNVSVEGRKKLPVYLFNTREQWEDFTSLWTGSSAEDYLKIPEGAYYAEGACVMYHIYRQVNFSILAHEGWHQFVDQYFTFQAPSWINEGVATGFETFVWDGGQVVFRPEQNRSRLMTLHQAMLGNELIPLAELVKLDPGHFLDDETDGAQNRLSSSMGIYYAQVYALVRFFRETGQGRYLYTFQEMLGDGYKGEWPLGARERLMASRMKNRVTRGWNQRVGPLLIESYFNMTVEDLEPAYRAFCQKIAASIR
ncbi:MAG: hypothetical protein GY869_03420 [Planctomycetes bacterium]|nr:hypothetical protein [Planctomycetota bacterium]